MIDLKHLAKRAGGEFNGHDARIPGPGHGPTDRSLSLSIGDNGRLIWWSFSGDSNAAVRAYLKELGVMGEGACAEGAPLVAPERARRTDAGAHWAAALWRESIALDGTLGMRYLENRSIHGPFPPTLRFHKACRDGPFRRPALIAARTMLGTPDQVTSVQRTFLARDGNGKAPVKVTKKTLGACKGGGVVLGDIGEALLIAEGVETALSAAAIFRLPAAVATLGVAHTRKLIVPESVREIVIATDNDNDEAGRVAAEALAARLRREGRLVRVELPPSAYEDFNDLATSKERSVGAPRSIRGGGPPDGV